MSVVSLLPFEKESIFDYSMYINLPTVSTYKGRIFQTGRSVFIKNNSDFIIAGFIRYFLEHSYHLSSNMPNVTTIIEDLKKVNPENDFDTASFKIKSIVALDGIYLVCYIDDTMNTTSDQFVEAVLALYSVLSTIFLDARMIYISIKNKTIVFKSKHNYFTISSIQDLLETIGTFKDYKTYWKKMIDHVPRYKKLLQKQQIDVDKLFKASIDLEDVVKQGEENNDNNSNEERFFDLTEDVHTGPES